MGIFEAIRKNRAKTKAEIKAAQARAKSEVKETAKLNHRRSKLLAKQEKSLLKAEKKGLKAKRRHEKKMAKNQLAQIKQGRFNAQSVRRYTAAARMVVPLALPLIYRGVTLAREQLEKQQARRNGVTTEQLARYSGHGAPLKARIDGIRDNLDSAPVASGFRIDAKERLDELVSAVNNAEYLAPQQRRRSHSTVARELDNLAAQIQERLQSRS
ncbi:DUF6474 family protein [Corynebacterium sp. CCM 9185]|uniref:Uncharacterized protein n=1 Tax=Corynebacterium marambiense TaxID=2765364 RepID=A0ABS0VWK9_9CORY|nr:DUF6474 family protein [Corynebacterium marambiense]MBI9001166.1 hypothetical protein [Corynebacterium marambiense]MCK7663727.1 DUF6474 family protein [Corynebacterium marambiense]